MFYNNLKIAMRAMLKFKSYSIVNLSGLALGLTAGILILLYVLDELSYDQFHSKLDRIYRVETQFISGKSEGGGLGSMETNGWPIGDILRKDYPEVESVLYTRSAAGLLINYEGKRIRENIHYATPEFFTMFDFPLVSGNPATALNDPYSIVITETMADKYFKGTEALNKSLILYDTIQFVVTGVMKNIPSNSHIQLDMLISFSTFQKFNPYFSFDGGWGNINMHNYILLKEGANVETFAAKARNIYTERAGQMLKDWGVSANVVFAPLKDLYLTTKAGNSMGPVGSISRVYLVSGIAAFVILLACINFINLATARSVYRAKEVGLRKVVGSSRTALIRQFLSESLALTILALVLAVAFTGLILPLFNQLLAKNYQVNALMSPSILSGIAILVLMVTLLSGYYPAMVMSGMRPADVLKGKMQGSSRGVQLRRSLVVFQFVISVSLVLGTLIVVDQLQYMQTQDLGFAKDEIFVVNGRVRTKNPVVFQTFKDQIKSLALVNDVTYTNAIPGVQGWAGQVAYPEGRSGEDAVSVEYMAIDEHYLETLGLTLVAGRNFDINRQAELDNGLILNEAGAAIFGWTPQEAIGKKITSPSSFPAGEVIGVVKDYHELGLQQNIGPIAMDYSAANSYLYAIRYKAANTQQLISSLEQLWKQNFPGYDFNYFFLNENFEKQYQGEQRLAKVFGLFAIITIIIAVIGLLGLVSFMVTAKTKEIGVRKVLGADVMSITSMLSKEFLILVCIANVIAFPLAWYGANQWLQNFAYRMDLSPLLFVFTLLIAVFVTLLTISFQTIKAAMADPVKSLRYE